jgi:hypothetical protein
MHLPGHDIHRERLKLTDLIRHIAADIRFIPGRLNETTLSIFKSRHWIDSTSIAELLLLTSTFNYYFGFCSPALSL